MCLALQLDPLWLASPHKGSDLLAVLDPQLGQVSQQVDSSDATDTRHTLKQLSFVTQRLRLLNKVIKLSIDCANLLIELVNVLRDALTRSASQAIDLGGAHLYQLFATS